MFTCIFNKHTIERLSKNCTYSALYVTECGIVCYLRVKDRDFVGGANVPNVADPQLLPVARQQPNPPAVVSTSLSIYQHYTIHGAYNGNTVFWCTLPHAGESVTITFTPPIAIAR